MVIYPHDYSDESIHLYARKGKLCLEYRYPDQFGTIIHTCKTEILSLATLGTVPEEDKARSLFLISHPKSNTHKVLLSAKDDPRQPSTQQGWYYAYNLEPSGEISNACEDSFQAILQKHISASRRKVVRLELPRVVSTYFHPSKLTQQDSTNRQSLINVINEVTNYVPPKPYDPFEL